MGSLNWASGLIPLGRLHMKPLQRHLFTRSNRPVCSPVSIRPFSPCYPTQAVAGPIISHIRNPNLAFPGGFHNFHGCLYPGLGRSHGGFPDFGCLDPLRPQAPHQCAGAQGGNIGPPTLGLSITGPPCYDSYRQYLCCSLYKQTGWDPFPHPFVAGNGSVSMSTVSRYSHPGQTHSGLPHCDSRPVISAEPAHHDRVEPPPDTYSPLWPSQPWIPHLLCLCVDHPRFFQFRRDLLSQQGYVSSGKSYHLNAWRFSCSTTKQQDF